MQLLLPIFPKDITLITPNLGVYEKDGIVNYLHSGVPIGNHSCNDLKSFRCHTSRMIEVGLCRQSAIVRTFGVSSDSVKRSLKLFQQKGEKGFSQKRRHIRRYDTLFN